MIAGLRRAALGFDEAELDCVQTTERIVAAIREQIGMTLRRKGVVVALTGGVHSAVCAAL